MSIIFGDHSDRVTPVPIPNTEVKPVSADGTWGEAPWESRTSPDFLKKPPALGRGFLAFRRRFDKVDSTPYVAIYVGNQKVRVPVRCILSCVDGVAVYPAPWGRGGHEHEDLVLDRRHQHWPNSGIIPRRLNLHGYLRLGHRCADQRVTLGSGIHHELERRLHQSDAE